MSNMTKFNLLLDPGQVAALKEIQDATGAPLSVQIRRAINDWIAKRGSIPASRLLDEMQAIAAMPEPEDAAKAKALAGVTRAARSLRKSLAKRRELDAIGRGERTEEVKRFAAKHLRVKAERKRAGTRKRP